MKTSMKTLDNLIKGYKITQNESLLKRIRTESKMINLMKKNNPSLFKTITKRSKIWAD